MSEQTLSPAAEFAVYALVGLSLALTILNHWTYSLRIALANRWARWIGVSCGLAYVAWDLSWLDRPFWTLALLFFIGWLLVETLYNWFAINALSRSSLTLFPSFKENKSGEEWPAQKKLLEVKDWLQGKGFSRRLSAVAEVGHGIQVRSTLFESEDSKTRLQILFVPRRNGDIGHCYSFVSEAKSGERYLTDNFYMPYGGYYPDNWKVLRKPLSRNLQALYRLHRSRVSKLDLAEYETEALDELNERQRELEKANLRSGDLTPAHLQEEHGRISWEGRYRFWKEVWTLNYLGLSLAR